jgi:hypothetical protein
MSRRDDRYGLALLQEFLVLALQLVDPVGSFSPPTMWMRFAEISRSAQVESHELATRNCGNGRGRRRVGRLGGLPESRCPTPQLQVPAVCNLRNHFFPSRLTIG